MKASVLTQYGSADFFELQTIPKPSPKEDEVLVKIYASSINSWDWEILIAKPFINRMMVGLRNPSRIKVLGCDIAGIVESIGDKVTKFSPGDKLFADLSGCGWGGFAEYVCVSENANLLTRKPDNLSFEQAATIPQAAVLALQGLRKGNTARTRSILINGAGGGVGTFAVQLAKSKNVEVTAVDSEDKLDILTSLGADHVIDYKQQDFTQNGIHYDLILDIRGTHSIGEYRRVLSGSGHYVAIGGTTSLINQILFLGTLSSISSSKKMGLLMHRPSADDLQWLGNKFMSNEIVPVLDSIYSLSQVAEAMRHYQSGRVKGKIVISINSDSATA